jgi:uncharacterized coiled-coil DUF342 family protein
MAPKKAVETKKEEKPKKPTLSPEMKELLEQEKAIEKVPQPDRTALDANNEKTQTAINALQEKLKAINEKVNAKSTGKEEHFKARDEIRAKLDEYQGKIDELEKKRTALMGGIQAKQKESRDKRQELNDMKKKLGFDSEEEIEKKIREIEVEMMTGSMTLKKEKELMAKMTELRKSKPMVSKYQQMESNMGPTGEVGSMKDNITDLQKQLAELRDAKKLQSQAYSKLMEARQKVMGDVPGLFEEREKINASIREKIQERNAERDEFRKQERAFNDYLGKVRELRGKRAKLEREARQAEWDETRKAEKEAEGPPPLPFAEDLQYLENITKYLQPFLPKEAEKEEDKKEKVPDAIGGHMVLMSKESREDEFFYAPTKKKQLKKKGGDGKKAKPIVHSMEALSFFDKYKLPTPADSAAVPATLEAVEAKVKEFKAKQEKKIEEDKKKAEKKAAGVTEEAEEAAPAEESAEA